MKQLYPVKKAADQAFMTLIAKLLMSVFTVRGLSQSGWGGLCMWRGFFTFFTGTRTASDIFVV
jgi:hypothetical protein